MFSHPAVHLPVNFNINVGDHCASTMYFRRRSLKVAKLQMKETDQDPIITATALTEAIESIVQHPLTDSDVDIQIKISNCY